MAESETFQNPNIPDDICIVTENLTKRFSRDIIAIDNLSIAVKKGEIFGLLGPNGSGKTTTIRVLKGIISPSEGNAYVLGYSVHDNKGKQKIRSITGLLPENASVYERLTAYEYLELIGSLYRLSGRVLSDRILRLLEIFDLDDRKYDLLSSFSRGMRQKILISSTLLHDPEIIFLDEPLTSLDPRAARNVKDLIKVLSDLKKTVFLCSHWMSLAEDMCDRVAIIHKGQLLTLGTPTEIKSWTNTENLEEAFLSVIPAEEQKDFKRLYLEGTL
ncbi:MAG: ABC transporter ATP-binding protein [Candidatus Hermodarchaeota archaeon]